jgi:IS30 family transposase
VVDLGPEPAQPGLPREVRQRYWAAVRAGEHPLIEAAASAGVSRSGAKRWFFKAGGVMPPAPKPATRRPRLSFAERETIGLMTAAGQRPSAIAKALGRPTSTVTRELAKGSTTFPDRSPVYKPTMAQTRAEWRARRPQQTKLAASPELAAWVQDQLEEEHSPEQISNRLRHEFPDQETMRVSHEVIYQELYVQGRGTLRADLHKRLRTGRAVRKPRRAVGERRGRIPDMVNIAERPPEVDERTVPGHWEGDLIVGAQSQSAIGTLVERVSGFVLLLHLPDNHGADTVATAMIEAMSRLPETLRRTLTWDQGSEMRNHTRIAQALDLDIYFCDPHSPWQRPVNENTNGLLRQYFAKGSDLSVYAPDYLEHVARKLNNRPRKRHDWATPAEVLDQLLCEAETNGVASTA